VVAKAQAVLSESKLLLAIFDVGHFPPNTPPAERAPVTTRHTCGREQSNGHRANRNNAQHSCQWRCLMILTTLL
jgi:hypothetical protein